MIVQIWDFSNCPHCGKDHKPILFKKRVLNLEGFCPVTNKIVFGLGKIAEYKYNDPIICRFQCIGCGTKFYWIGKVGQSTGCVHCPMCKLHHQLAKDEDVIETSVGILDVVTCKKE